ncbi:DUF2512 family protein [Clostridium formicaceticum]|uniref:DUF2512 domain-containing protein n=1 Tax=Clostridium formicaceticum TaxID=1497 RepID=A0AAC9RQ57_9CLOT|nr:DUF2512 family protein [Clostridium formicaceticum]AOY74569.1 hypothetical protein BJL90_00515 [Clostridium formicaceticum]ARE88928.1 hypothetical protein CLFO_33340 [Clostridium formicaceticum]
MSNTTTALLVKLVMTFIAAWLTLGFMDGNPLVWVIIVAIVGTGLNYILGDLVVLPNLGNVVASIGDGVMAAVVAYVIAMFTRDFNTTFGTLIGLAIIVGVVEFFFHMYLQRADTVAPKEK